MVKIPKGAKLKLAAKPATKKKAELKSTKAGTKSDDVLLNVKQSAKRLSKAKAGALTMREELWPKIDESHLWLREDRTKKGFTTIPRAMPYFISIINDASKKVTAKATPAGRAYLALWCRVFDEGLVRIDSEAAAALEAGYGGERNITTWRQHLEVLKGLGFIDCAAGSGGPYQFILIFNPYHAVKSLKAKGWIQQPAFTALLQRATEIGATDLN